MLLGFGAKWLVDKWGTSGLGMMVGGGGEMGMVKARLCDVRPGRVGCCWEWMNQRSCSLKDA